MRVVDNERDNVTGWHKEMQTQTDGCIRKRTQTGFRAAWFLTITAAMGVGTAAARADTFNIEIDYMVDSGIGGHSHQPNDIEIAAVVQMFACQGHVLNIEVDDALPHYTQLRNDPNNCRNVFDYSGANGSFGKLKQDYFDHAGEGGWHYCIFAHFIENGECQWTGASGVAEIGGDDLIVSLGDFDLDIGTPWDRAGTLAHEFGHNLGLYHCGAAGPCGDPDQDPYRVGPYPLNLPSIMSYFYQLRGVRANMECQGLVPEGLPLFKNLDYSHGTMCTLDEAGLNESLGTGMRAVDWSCDGSIGGVVAHDLSEDSSGWCGATSGLQVLRDFDEWAAIRDSTRRRSGPLEQLPISRCVSADEIIARQTSRGICPQPPAVPEACILGLAQYISNDGPTSELGTCSAPFGSVEDANRGAVAGSIIFATPGTYNEVTPLILDSSIILTSPGTAVIR